jgi:hypothetical protein
VKTLGNKWSDFQTSRFNSNSQPFYVLLGHDEQLLSPPTGAVKAGEYLEFLNSGLKTFNK